MKERCVYQTEQEINQLTEESLNRAGILFINRYSGGAIIMRENGRELETWQSELLSRLGFELEFVGKD